MSPELDDALCRDFPLLFRARREGGSNMIWGFEFDDGWEPITRKYAAQIEAILKKLPKKQRKICFASQLKEKFGTLRWYMTGAPSEIHDLVDQAELESERTCETCGNVGAERCMGTWMYTRCQPCWDEMERLQLIRDILYL